jgi:hypothetical protein
MTVVVFDDKRVLVDKLCRRIADALTGLRCPLENEKDLQAFIASRFERDGITHVREVAIVGGIIDFLVWSDRTPRVRIGCEVKIKGRERDIARQLARYATEHSIDALMLLTARRWPDPFAGVGKPVTVFDLSRAWL